MNQKVPFYLSNMVIIPLVLLGTVLPPLAAIAIVLLLVKKSKFINVNKKDLEVLNTLNNIDDEIAAAQQRKDAQQEVLDKQIQSLNNEISNLQKILSDLDADSMYALTKVDNYESYSSEEIKNELAKLQLKEKDLLKSEEAVIILNTKVAKKIINTQAKQLLRSFNNETDVIFAKTTVKNIDSMRKKLVKTYETLNTLYRMDEVQISNALLDIKLDELNAVYQYQLKLEIEREQRQAIKEQMVEEEKVRREIEAAKKKIDKEEHQFKNEVERLMKYMQKSTNDIEKNIYIDKIKELEAKLSELEVTKQDVLNREQNTRAGFVYIISNIGSFGENIFKIGMTRRLEPMDRIKELSSASVPFEFDVHAIIFSDDAPGLETTLHQTFKDHQVNKINYRKEFYNIPLDAIEEVVTKHHNATVDWTVEPAAIEYRESLKLLSE